MVTVAPEGFQARPTAPGRRRSGMLRTAGVPSIPVIEPVSLVEREEQLASLFHLADAGTGSAVLLSGEAGFGKTSLLRAFLGGLDHRHRILEAACEPVGIPTAFSPLFDLLDDLPTELCDDIRTGSGRTAVYAGMLDLLKGDRIVLVVEDVHWADEATLGLLRYLGRRIAPTKSLLIGTYRPEDLDLAHPMHLVVADLGPTATRIELPPLTPSGVEAMTRGLAIDPKRIHEATLGNPFLVEEVIRHPDSKLPSNISNAVLARAANFSSEALETLYSVALSPDGVSLDILLALDPAAGSFVDLAVQRRLLVSSDGQVTCRHDLIRHSLEAAVPPALRRELHRRLLEQLEEQVDEHPDLSRLAYHSLGAHDDLKAVTYSLQAAEGSARGGAHRQAAYHYSNALLFRGRMTVGQLRETLLAAAHEHCLTNASAEACGYAAELVEIAETKIETAGARAWLSYYMSRDNDLEATHQIAGLAVEVLEDEPPSEELALALASRAWVAMVEGRLEEAVEDGNRAIDAARAAGSARVEVHAATTVGTAMIQHGDITGRALIEAATSFGMDHDVDEETARSINNTALGHTWFFDLPGAREHNEKLVEFTTARELDAWYITAVANLAEIDVASSRWEDADRELAMVLGQTTCRQTEVSSLMIAATLEVRRGAPGAELKVESALDRARGSTDHDMVRGAALLALQAAWTGVIQLSEAMPFVEEAHRLPGWTNDDWGRAMLGFWAMRTGIDPPEGDLPGAAGMEQTGKLAEAVDAWNRAGYSIEATICRALSPGADLDEIFSSFAALGADGAARGLRHELQRRGVKNVPRGERRSTRANPAGLTARQAEVLSLMQTGLSNAAIAETLFISEKTAGHHVSAILAKLNVTSRLEAVAVTSGKGRDRAGV
jgi:DNA-binding CsgD family transcriptional regulator